VLIINKADKIINRIGTFVASTVMCVEIVAAVLPLPITTTTRALTIAAIFACVAANAQKDPVRAQQRHHHQPEGAMIAEIVMEMGQRSFCSFFWDWPCSWRL